jgi:hypothetical protein
MTSHFRVNNFSRDVSDGINYTYLLHQLDKEKCSLEPLRIPDLRMRAEQASVPVVSLLCLSLTNFSGA